MRIRRFVAAALTAALAAGLCPSALAAGYGGSAADGIAEYILDETEMPAPADAAAVIALSRSGAEVPEGYYELYARETAAALDGGDICDSISLSLTAIALSAVGFEPDAAADGLRNYDAVVSNGVPGAALALIALRDMSGYGTEFDRYLGYILSRSLPEGGFSAPNGDGFDAAVTALALQALAPYADSENVAPVIEAALTALSAAQNEDGGFSASGVDSLTATALVSIALDELGISDRDARFVRGGTSPDGYVLSALSAGDEPAGVTEAAVVLLALASDARSSAGAVSVFDMSDVTADTPAHNVASAMRSPDVRPVPEPYVDISFNDISGHKNRIAISELASRGIITGFGNNTFCPDNTITRAEFTVVVVRALGLEPETSGEFSDVPSTHWAAPYIDTACRYGIISGKDESTFDPDGLITRQEAAAMISRAASLCGFDAYVSESESISILSEYDDAASADGWALPYIAFCCREGLMPTDGSNIEPRRYILRCEISQMLYDMLIAAGMM